MEKLNIVCALCAALALAGCATAGNQVLKTETEETVAAKISKGMTTQADVRRVYGDPSSTSFTDSGNQIWNYEYASASPKAQNFIPVVGLLAGGADVDKKTLVILFDGRGVVTNYTISSSQQEVRSGLLNR